MNNPLTKVRKGMQVYDQAGQEVGTVEYIQFGDEDPLRPGIETASISPAVLKDRNRLVESLAEIFRPDDLPDITKERLLRYGFIRVDAPGLFNADRYIFPQQIQSVDEKQVTLNVSRSELVHRT